MPMNMEHTYNKVIEPGVPASVLNIDIFEVKVINNKLKSIDVQTRYTYVWIRKLARLH